MTWFLILPFFIGMICGVPISFSLALGALCAVLSSERLSAEILANQMFSMTQSFPLMAVPFFLFAGELMNRTGITSRLVKFVILLVGRMHGGLGHAMVVTGTIFAGLSGSGAADTAALGKILGPAMVKEGYPIGYASAIAASVGVLGPIIPPSIVCIVYGCTVNVSIGALFMAGIMPGILLGLGLMLVNGYTARKKNFPRDTTPFSGSALLQGFKDASLALLMPIFILYAIRGGICTPTEGGAVAAAYAMFLGLVVYRSLSIRDCADAAVAAAITSAVVLFVVSSSAPFGWMLAVNRIPQAVSTFLMTITTNKYLMLFMINILLLFMGMLLETNSIILLVAPILAPVAVSLGVNPIHFGMITVVNLCIGLMTPPLGMCLFVGASTMEIRVEETIKNSYLFLIVDLIVLGLITYFPEVTLCIPRWCGLM